MFEILHKDPDSNARLGRITTKNGTVETPSYVIVGTNAFVRCLEPEDLPSTKTQMIIANTYHLWRSLGEAGLEEFPGLHTEMGWKGPIMTDSGGFQVFSHGALRSLGAGKVHHDDSEAYGSGESVVTVTDSGVYFTVEGKEEYLDAELSMKIQEQLGADIIVAFDEPSSPLHDYEYTKTAMHRTHAWAERSLEAKVSDQKIYGVVQGGIFEDLRKESAQVIGAMPFDGICIGGCFGTSYGSSSILTLEELRWTIPYLPEFKPRHLLGMGKIHDLFNGIEAGIDTFDCVIPTREARHGRLWTSEGPINILRGAYRGDETAVDPACECKTCIDEGITRGALHAMFKEKNQDAGKHATMHNIFFFNTLMEQIRDSIRNGQFASLKREWFKKLEKSGGEPDMKPDNDAEADIV